ncbi:MAG: BREX system P-loop protein BrxC [Prolixibacteraceae bacterium]|nr:BREX system P-loop protein BrxC [Prolixibacteraceae bacterium]
MILKNFFSNDINRNIETVIKADDQEHILDELQEYVVTNEIANKTRDFFSAYNDYQGANGVWISGFFGSGKSHLLKILSYVLENKEFNGYKPGEIFAGKISDDAILKADIINATRIPSESVLFNIDQQAQITSKNEEDALLRVFYKVFYDHLGYFGSQSHVADFEQWVAGEGIYKLFQEKFEKETGEFWSNARRKYFSPSVKNGVGKVLAELLGGNPGEYDNIIETMRKDSVISIDDFCEKINDYLKSKPKGFRLNFFVDEVGQFISDNTKLMLNLQTIAETMAVKTQGNTWIFVTSQEDMERVVGDMTKNQQNDFSRIQARFLLKVPLSSANVDEVIEKRLLSKTPEATTTLKQIWENKQSAMETLLAFSESGVQFRGYRNDNDFISKYPFVSYQFDLFQQCIKALSNHNAFQGRHASVGERSMLGVFQFVIQKIEQKNENAIVSFDLLFDGIRSTIRSELQSAIILAERNIDDLFAVKVLKALFMVKYYRNFKTTSRNIATLMIDNILVDVKAHDQKVTEALNLLENQTYIQRNGDLYEFLTDDEKDIEKEIKATDIDDSQITSLFKEIVFDEIIRDSKIRFLDNKQEYEFTSKIDGSILGKEKELTVEVISPNFYDHDREDFFKSQTMGYNTLMMMVLPNDEYLLQDIRLYIKTEKYIRQNQTTSNTDNIKRLLFEKSQQNIQRRASVVNLLKRMLGNADVYMNGLKQEMAPSGDGKNKLVLAFQNLVKLAYPNLKMLGNTQFSEDTIKSIIRNNQDGLFGTEATSLSEPESEVLNIIHRRKKQSERTSLIDVRDYFSRRPYGWYPSAIWSIIAKLYKRGSIEIRQDSNLLNDNEVLNALMNSRLYANTLLEPQVDIDPKQIKALSAVYNEFFDEPCPAKEAKDVALAFKNKLNDEYLWLNKMLASKEAYPFLADLENVSSLISRLQKKEYTYYLTNLKEFEDELLDDKEQLIDPIKRFWNGEQKRIFDSIRLFFTGNQSNLEYIEKSEIDELRAVIEHPKPYTGNLIKEAKAKRDALAEKVLQLISQEKQHTKAEIESIMERIKINDDFNKLDDTNQQIVLKPFVDELDRLKEQRFIANLRQTAAHVSGVLFEQQLNKTARMANPPAQVQASPVNNAAGKTTSPQPAEPVVHYRRLNTIKFDFAKSELRTHDDVERYTETLKKELIKLIDQNKRITL